MTVPALKMRRNANHALGVALTREVGLQKLLATPVAELDLHPEGVLAECLEQVRTELRAKGLTFSPHFYLGDDDFWTADRATSINVPWYLANGFLWRMVNDHLFEYSRTEVMMYLRHEVGHALNYSYELWRRKDWTQIFGDFRRPYRDVYASNPRSHDHVRYLHRTGLLHYAQKHPDEDWAETFATWLDPASRWRRRYKDWQVALAKLEYVDRILDVEGLCNGPPPNGRVGTRIPYTDIKETVADCFDLQDAMDPLFAEHRRDLLQIFERRPPQRLGSPRRRAAFTEHADSAARFIQQNQDLLIDRLAAWIGRADRRVIKRFLRHLQAICTYEHLVVPEKRRDEKLVDLTIVATWHVVDGIHQLSR